MVVRHRVGAGNLTRLLRERHKSSKPRSHLSSSCCLFIGDANDFIGLAYEAQVKGYLQEHG